MNCLFACNKTEELEPEETLEGTEYSFDFSYNNKKYTVFFLNKDWKTAAEYAVSKNGYLIEINSKEEQEAILTVLLNFSDKFSKTIAPDGGNYPHFWIGANDFLSEGAWVWDGDNKGEALQFWQGSQNGTSIAGRYNNWGNEPSNGAGGQNAGGIVPTDWTNGIAGTWNDVKETNSLYFIVEYVG